MRWLHPELLLTPYMVQLEGVNRGWTRPPPMLAAGTFDQSEWLQSCGVGRTCGVGADLWSGSSPVEWGVKYII